MHLPQAKTVGLRSGLLLLLSSIRGGGSGNGVLLADVMGAAASWRRCPRALAFTAVPSPPRQLPTGGASLSAATGFDNQNREMVLPLSLPGLLICRVCLLHCQINHMFC
jgi:hypothetical protein